MKYNVSKLHGIAEVQTKFHWNATFTGAMAGFGEKLEMRMVSSSIPKPVHEKIEVNAHGYKFPGPGIVRKNGSIELKAFETVGAEVTQPLFEWYSKIYNSVDKDMQGKQTVAYGDLFGTVTLELLNKQENKTTQTYTLQKVIITEFDPGGELDTGDQVGYFEPVLTLEYAWFNWGVGSGTSL